MWFWLALAALLFWSGSDLFSKIGCRDGSDKRNHLKMVVAVGVVMGLHALYEIFVQGAVIRLGYFNVTEEERQRICAEPRKKYQGLPVTTVAMLDTIFVSVLEMIVLTPLMSVFILVMMSPCFSVVKKECGMLCRCWNIWFFMNFIANSMAH